MSDYRINFGNTVGPSDSNKLYDMLGILGGEDELIITLDAAGEPSQYDTIFKVLEENEFNVSTKGGHEGGKYHIIAKRKG
ncbi:MAG: hypothetical protein K0R09_3540 [Clostridiales bacterium]|jgi:hypothetical protein|nr:hypothetical protein [Clostridiales bacterium]